MAGRGGVPVFDLRRSAGPCGLTHLPLFVDTPVWPRRRERIAPQLSSRLSVQQLLVCLSRAHQSNARRTRISLLGDDSPRAPVDDIPAVVPSTIQHPIRTHQQEPESHIEHENARTNQPGSLNERLDSLRPGVDDVDGRICSTSAPVLESSTSSVPAADSLVPRTCSQPSLSVSLSTSDQDLASMPGATSDPPAIDSLPVVGAPSTAVESDLTQFTPRPILKRVSSLSSRVKPPSLITQFPSPTAAGSPTNGSQSTTSPGFSTEHTSPPTILNASPDLSSSSSGGNVGSTSAGSGSGGKRFSPRPLQSMSASFLIRSTTDLPIHSFSSPNDFSPSYSNSSPSSSPSSSIVQPFEKKTSPSTRAVGGSDSTSRDVSDPSVIDRSESSSPSETTTDFTVTSLSSMSSIPSSVSIIAAESDQPQPPLSSQGDRNQDRSSSSDQSDSSASIGAELASSNIPTKISNAQLVTSQLLSPLVDRVVFPPARECEPDVSSSTSAPLLLSTSSIVVDSPAPGVLPDTQSSAFNPGGDDRYLDPNNHPSSGPSSGGFRVIVRSSPRPPSSAARSLIPALEQVQNGEPGQRLSFNDSGSPSHASGADSTGPDDNSVTETEYLAVLPSEPAVASVAVSNVRQHTSQFFQDNVYRVNAFQASSISGIPESAATIEPLPLPVVSTSSSDEDNSKSRRPHSTSSLTASVSSSALTAVAHSPSISVTPTPTHASQFDSSAPLASPTQATRQPPQSLAVLNRQGSDNVSESLGASELLSSSSSTRPATSVPSSGGSSMPSSPALVRLSQAHPLASITYGNSSAAATGTAPVTEPLESNLSVPEASAEISSVPISTALNSQPSVSTPVSEVSDPNPLRISVPEGVRTSEDARQPEYASQSNANPSVSSKNQIGAAHFESIGTPTVFQDVPVSVPSTAAPPVAAAPTGTTSVGRSGRPRAGSGSTNGTAGVHFRVPSSGGRTPLDGMTRSWSSGDPGDFSETTTLDEEESMKTVLEYCTYLDIVFGAECVSASRLLNTSANSLTLMRRLIVDDSDLLFLQQLCAALPDGISLSGFLHSLRLHNQFPSLYSCAQAMESGSIVVTSQSANGGGSRKPDPSEWCRLWIHDLHRHIQATGSQWSELSEVKCASENSSYMSHMAAIHNVRCQCDCVDEELNGDYAPKYLAHKLALLHQVLRQLGTAGRPFRKMIEEQFENIKSATEGRDEVSIPDSFRQWVDSLLYAIRLATENYPRLLRDHVSSTFQSMGVELR